MLLKAVVLLVAYLVFVTDARPYLRVYEPQLGDDEEIIEMNEDSEDRLLKDMIVNSMKTDDMANAQVSINAMLNTIITNQIKNAAPPPPARDARISAKLTMQAPPPPARNVRINAKAPARDVRINAKAPPPPARKQYKLKE